MKVLSIIIFTATILSGCVQAVALIPVIVAAQNAYQAAKPVAIEIRKLHELKHRP